MDAWKHTHKPSYNDVFLQGWRRVIEKFKDKKTRFYSEFDITCSIFHECLKLMENWSLDLPYKIHTEIQPYPYKINAWADLVLGSNEVIIETKYLNRFESAVTTKRREATKDVKKLSKYVEFGAKHAYFVMLDEQGHCKRHKPWSKLDWRSMKINGEEYHFLLLKVVMGEKSEKMLILSESEIYAPYDDA